MFKRIKDLFNPNFVCKVNRCNYCKSIITDWQIKKGIFCRCGSNRVVMTNPTTIEKIKVIFFYIVRGY